MSLADEIKAKIELEDRERNRKISALKKLDAGALVAMIPGLESTLETVLREESSFKDLNAGFLSSGTNDCAETKRILAELSAQNQGKNKEERDAWLIRQRKTSPELKAAIDRQKTVAFDLGNNQISIEMARKRLDNVLKVITLRTAQIRFLTS